VVREDERVEKPGLRAVGPRNRQVLQLALGTWRKDASGPLFPLQLHRGAALHPLRVAAGPASPRR
jgi:hypothetical protein